MTPAATATRPWTPTIEDIEQALSDWHARWGSVHHDDETLKLAIDEYADVVDHTLDLPDQDDEPCQLWRDLRPSQATRLRELADQAKVRAHSRCREVILAELLVAAQTFAAEHPDAPRPEVTA
ncbi:MAG: hypothetical protein KF809_02785 [Chloroflexi bacterium]|nr:hypothetical protein [Chloroflexota bacterium]